MSESGERGEHMLRLGVILIAGMAILSGLVGLVVGGLAVAAGAALTLQAPVGQISAEGLGGQVLITAGLIVLIIGVAQLIVGVGLWRLRRWAWRLGIGVEILTFVVGVAGLFTGAFTVQSVISLIISGIILLYLLSPHVRRRFGAQAHTKQDIVTHG